MRSPPLIPVNTSTPFLPSTSMLSKARRLAPVASKMMSNGPYSLAASFRGFLRVLTYLAPRASTSSLLSVGGSVRASVVTSKPRSRRMSVARLEPAYVRPNLQYAPERLVADNQELVTHRSFAILGVVDFLVSPIQADAQHLHQNATPAEDVVHFWLRQVCQVDAVRFAWENGYRFHRELLSQWMYFPPVNKAALRRDQDIYRLVCVVGTLANTRLAALSESTVEVEGGADEGQVREGLGEVSQRLAAGSDLLGVETEVISVA